ncbi:hypothetical protein JHU38_08110 [Prevotella sp. A2931]|uniref:DUF5723 domain-containing protein n=2 Tax=Prevotellaceae TaxID=171552 RepID=A0ABS3M6C2_9BACT|nr:hypothetical protein [Prevotella illustrans]PTL25577.1 hypothetical protein C3V39_11555 [Prevotella sp. oral taxon 820]
MHTLDGLGYRLQLNPALRPDQGYFNIPIIGGTEVTASSNSLGSKDIVRIIGNNSDTDYYTDNAFYNRLKTENKLQANVTLDLLSFGWYKGKNFWNVNISMKNDVEATIPHRVFESMRDARGLGTQSWANYMAEQGGTKVFANSYVETGLGFARNINEKLTIGGKMKLLFGTANLKMDIRKLNLQTNLTGTSQSTDWETIDNEALQQIHGQATIDVEAEIEASMKGFELKDDDGYVKRIGRGGSFGIAGFGLGLDLGATYKPIDNLMLSAAVLDLGFISWSKASSHTATTTSIQKYRFDNTHLDEAESFRDIMTNGQIADFDMLKVKQKKGKARSTALYSTVVLGGEYQLPDTKFCFGLLSTTRFSQLTTQTELTLSSGYKINRSIGFSLAYSMIQSGGKGLGIGLKLGPVILATDYMYFGNNSKCTNLLLGFSVPMGARKHD